MFEVVAVVIDARVLREVVVVLAEMDDGVGEGEAQYCAEEEEDDRDLHTGGSLFLFF